MNKDQALEVLYAASRKALMSADDHDACKKAGTVIFQALKPSAAVPPVVELKPQTPEKK